MVGSATWPRCGRPTRRGARSRCASPRRATGSSRSTPPGRRARTPWRSGLRARAASASSASASARTRSSAARRRRRELRHRGPLPGPPRTRSSPAFVPAAGLQHRATTRPTSRSRGCSRPRGYGVLVDDDETSRFRPRQPPWSVGGRRRRSWRFGVFAGPTPGRRAAALHRRASAASRRAAAPFYFGPWLQPRATTPRRPRRRCARPRRAGSLSPRPTRTTCPAATSRARRDEQARDRAASTPPASPSRPTSTRWSARATSRATTRPRRRAR